VVGGSEVSMDELLRDFLTETVESLDSVDAQLVQLEREPNNREVLGNIFRLVHTIKGTCGFLGLPRLEALTHAAESLMGKFRDGMPITGETVTLILATIDRVKIILDGLENQQREPPGDDADLIAQLGRIAGQVHETRPVHPQQSRGLTSQERPSAQTGPEILDSTNTERPVGETPGSLANQSIRVSIDTLDRLMMMVSELVLTRNQLLEILRKHNDSEFKVALQRLSNVTTDVQQGVMKTRMQPIGQAWQKLPRIVRDLSVELGKEIELQMHGADTELDRQVLDLVKDPLTHLVRNCADHGIESPAERSAAGKPGKGTIRLAASRQGGYIVIEIADDGRGLDAARIRAKALEAGLASEAEIAAKPEAEINNFIFAPGFSTAPEVTSISGRGVGMDVVRSNIEQIGGTVDVTSVAGRGASFIIKIPLTLAIVAALILEVAGERFAFPQLSVLELVRIGGGAHRVERIKNAPVLRLRQKLLPLLHLKEVLQLGTGAGERGFAVVTQAGGQTFGAIVDNLFHTEEIVIKPVSSRLRHIGMFSGMTILGDGSVVMVLDPNSLAQTLGRVTQPASSNSADTAQRERTPHPDAVSLLLFRAGSQRRKAVPLSLVTRIEDIDCRRIEVTDGQHLLQYRDQLIPLLGIDLQSAPKKEGAQPILVFSSRGRTMGLAIDEIIDIVEDKLDIKLVDDRPGVLGYAVIGGVTTEIVDLGSLPPSALEDRSCRPGWAPTKSSGAILLIDDSTFFRALLTPVIEAAGYQVLAVDSATEALAALRSGARFDLVVSDTELPDMDGFALAYAMRQLPSVEAIPIIGVAETILADAVERGRAAGIRDFVAKFDRAGLVASIKAHTGQLGRAA
jgi:two-component system chemotaxis sensor kinase CheA